MEITLVVFYLLIMQGGQTGTLNRLMGLCQFESLFHTLAETTAAMFLCAPHRRWEVKMRLHFFTTDNPIVHSMPWLM